MNRILVPTDLSDCAENALRTAAGLARMSGAVVHLVHVYADMEPGYLFSAAESVEEQTAKAISDINLQLQQLAGHRDLKGVKVETSCIVDRPLWRVLHGEHGRNTSVVIMGSHGTSGAKEFLFGSNAQRMVQMATCPVLVVKDHFDLSTVKDLVFACNFGQEAIPAFKPIKDFIDLLGTRTHLLKVITPNNFEGSEITNELMARFCEAVALEDYTVNVMNAFTVEEGIAQFMESCPAELLCMETHGREGFSHLISGSIAESAVAHFNGPVLTVNMANVKAETTN